MTEQEENRTEPATEFRLREAKRKGQVAKSAELVSLLFMVGLLAVIEFFSDGMIVGQLRLFAGIWEQLATVKFTADMLHHWLLGIAINAATISLPLIAISFGIAVLANVIQTGPTFSVFPIKPDFQRLHPVSGLKRLFSIKTLFESAKTTVKIVVLGWVLFYTLIHFVPSLLAMMTLHPNGYPPILRNAFSAMVLNLAAAMLLIAIVDTAYTRWDYGMKMRMSRRELKEEVRRREGDPQVRARIRELQREAVKRSKALRSVPDADVLITNPTHLAIALEYDRNTMNAPHVTAKGAGELAERMKAIARKHRVAIVEDRTLARRLFKDADIGSPIHESYYPIVAKVLAQVLAKRGANAPARVK